jgi:hypothetical protein
MDYYLLDVIATETASVSMDDYLALFTTGKTLFACTISRSVIFNYHSLALSLANLNLPPIALGSSQSLQL